MQRRFRCDRDLDVGLDAIDHRIVRGRAAADQPLPITIIKPAPRHLGAGDRLTTAIRLCIASFHHEIERHRQARRDVAAVRSGLEPRKAIDQPDLAAGLFRDIGAIHAVDDAGQHEARLGGFQIGAIEQLDVETFAAADGLAWRDRLVLRDVAIELRIDRRRNRLQLRQRSEQQIAGQRNIRVPLRLQQAGNRQSIALVELAEEIGIGDRGAACERRVLRCRERHDAAKQQNGSQKDLGSQENSQRAPHASTNTAHGSLFK